MYYSEIVRLILVGIACILFGFGIGILQGPSECPELPTLTSDYAEFNIKFATIYVEKDGDWTLVAEEKEIEKLSSEN